MQRLVCVMALFAWAIPASAEVQARTVEYRHGDAALEGYLAHDDAVKGRRPGVLVVHEWKGLNEYAQRRARQLAELGYVAFAADMYGKGIRAQDHVEAGKLSGIYRSDRALMRSRAMAALDVLASQPQADPARLAAIGYCFGGTTVLELARAGADLLAVASFHGALETPMPAEPGIVKAKVLILHGAADGFVPPEQVAKFRQEMDEARAEYRVIEYPGAVHSFTVAEAGDDPSQGMAYNAEADQASWNEMRALLAEVFAAEE